MEDRVILLEEPCKHIANPYVGSIGGLAMIEYNIKKDGKVVRKFITRTCDLCGSKRMCYSSAVLASRKKRGNKKDYCKKCGYKIRVLFQKKGADSPFWRGGKRLNSNGYYRIYVYENGEKRDIYEHKYIYEQHVGRHLTVDEKVHHIDGNKLNNHINNLYLCEGKKEHHSMHYQLESLAFELLGTFIWFNIDAKKYILNPSPKNNYANPVFKSALLSNEKDNNGKIYINIYLGNKKHQRYHRYIMEKVLGRSLSLDEHIHHIDGVTTNNDVDNLIVLSRSEHKKCHNSLQSCMFKLFEDKKITFCNGEYSICPVI